MGSDVSFELGAAPSSIRLRRALFEDVGAVLGVCQRAVDVGCRDHYDPDQRRAVYLSYVTTAFLDVMLAHLDTFVLECGDQVIGVTQLDCTDGRLRALFVDPVHQGRGHGRTLLDGVVLTARRRGVSWLRGAMSLNAVPFDRRAGFSPCGPIVPLSGRHPLVPILPMEKRL